MEVTNTKKRVDKTQFNVDISKQFVPYWNGLLHLVGNVKNGVIIRRYDWDDVIQECEKFEKDYMVTENFCETCGFYDIPLSVDRIIRDANSRGVYDCKMIAEDNDIVYTVCIKRYRARRNLIIGLVILFLLLVAIIAGVVYIVRKRQQPQ